MKDCRVVVNGTFDVLHVGHLKLLKYAKSFHNAYVFVLIDSDERVKQLKGEKRPINNEYERKFLLESLKYVDKVLIFKSDDDLSSKIKAFNPHIMVKGSDYKGKHIIGSEHCEQIYFYDRLVEYSSTKKIQYIADRR